MPGERWKKFQSHHGARASERKSNALENISESSSNTPVAQQQISGLVSDNVGHGSSETPYSQNLGLDLLANTIGGTQLTWPLPESTMPTILTGIPSVQEATNFLNSNNYLLENQRLMWPLFHTSFPQTTNLSLPQARQVNPTSQESYLGRNDETPLMARSILPVNSTSMPPQSWISNSKLTFYGFNL